MDTFIYLTSNGSKTLYPENSPHSFTNDIPDIILDPQYTYEIALHSIILPRNFHSLISPNDYIDVYKGEQQTDKSITNKRFWFRIYAPDTFTFSDTREAYNHIDSFLVRGLRQHLGFREFHHFFPKQDWAYVLKWNHEQKRMFTGAGGQAQRPKLREIYKDRVDEFDPNTDCIFLKPNRKLRQMLGFSEIVDIVIYHPDWKVENDLYSDIEPRLGRDLLDGIMVYCDVTQPVRMDNQLVNLLDVFSFDDRLGKVGSVPIYHPLIGASGRLSTISIKLRDQSGSPLPVDEEGGVILTLHLRPK